MAGSIARSSGGAAGAVFVAGNDSGPANRLGAAYADHPRVALLGWTPRRCTGGGLVPADARGAGWPRWRDGQPWPRLHRPTSVAGHVGTMHGRRYLRRGDRGAVDIQIGWWPAAWPGPGADTMERARGGMAPAPGRLRQSQWRHQRARRARSPSPVRAVALRDCSVVAGARSGRYDKRPAAESCRHGCARPGWAGTTGTGQTHCC